VLEGRDHARTRGARPLARISSISSDRSRRQPGEIEATLRREWSTFASSIEPAHAAVLSGATGLEPATSAERHVLEETGLPVRNTGTYIGHGIEAQFVANLAIACAALQHGELFSPTGSGDTGESPPGLSQLVVTGVGSWRGEGLALLERVD
jgi:3-oxoacyl-[acyl-carrier-protein] synthase II